MAAEIVTVRELEVLSLIAEDRTEREIARRLRISRHSVHDYKRRVKDGLGVTTMAGAVHRAHMLGFLS